MQTVSTSQSVVIPAPPWYCFDRYTDLAGYPLWEPSTRRVTEMELSPDGSNRRVAFEIERGLLGITFYKFNYSLRAEVHALGKDSFFIKFDDARGDLHYVLTIVEFRPHGATSTRMSYKSVIGDPYRFKRTLMTLFGPSELRRHLDSFKRYVVQCAAAGSPNIEGLVRTTQVA